MVRVSKVVGFVVGAGLAVITREYFIYPYALRVQDMQEDFNHYEKEANKVQK